MDVEVQWAWFVKAFHTAPRKALIYNIMEGLLKLMKLHLHGEETR